MGRKIYIGFIFISYAGDHDPFHIHILTLEGRNIGRFDIENQCPLDVFTLTKRLKKALIDLGYMTKEEEN